MIVRKGAACARSPNLLIWY